ncbi:MAG: TolC family protein [Bacteroidetes bacterium]|nr:TolC family protein [Bacteroidota bacterium]
MNTLLTKASWVAGMLFILFLAKTTTVAQKIWTLEDCINYALTNNLDIKNQVLTVEANKKQHLQSILGLLPDLNGDATNTWNFGQTIDMYTNTFATTTVRSNNFYISSNLTLFSGLTRLNTIQKNKINILASNYDLDVIRNNISLAVAGYYLDILLNSELLDVARAQRDVTTDQVTRIRKRVDAGSSARGDLLNIQAQESADDLTVITTENLLNISNLTLQQLIDLPVTKDFIIEKPRLKSVEAPKDLLTPEQVFGYALLSRPEIKSAELKVKMSEKNLAISRGSLSPVLTAGGTWGTGYSGAAKEVDPNSPVDSIPYFVGKVNGNGDPVYKSYPVYSYRVKSFSDQISGNDNKSLGFNLRIPIFNGWQVRTAIAQAKIQVDQAELNLEMQKRNLRKSIEQAYADAAASLKKYKSATAMVTAQEESFKYTQEKFDVGMLTSFDFNTSKKDLVKARSELLQAKYDFIFKSTILNYYMGKPISINQ